MPYYQYSQCNLLITQKFLGVILTLGTSGGLAIMHRVPVRHAPWAAATAARHRAG